MLVIGQPEATGSSVTPFHSLSFSSSSEASSRQLCDIACSTFFSFSISIKLLALKAVHSLLDYPTAMEQLSGMEWKGHIFYLVMHVCFHLSFLCFQTYEHAQTPYQKILALVLTQQVCLYMYSLMYVMTVSLPVDGACQGCSTRSPLQGQCV